MHKPDDQKKNTWIITGPMTHETVPRLLKEGISHLNQCAEGLYVDLGKAEQCDSAGVALCIELLRDARRQNKQIVFCNPPSRMIDMIRVSGVDTLLPLKNKAIA